MSSLMLGSSWTISTSSLGRKLPVSTGIVTGASFTDASFTDASFTGAPLTGASFTGAPLTGASWGAEAWTDWPLPQPPANSSHPATTHGLHIITASPERRRLRGLERTPRNMKDVRRT
ncbi:pentapeptide repeat-containing protein [Chloracidobacterium sp. D]|uniref:pentapeptide repeat-containing protein n=1 Tax=Chloracidobacterium sp. D TaxID=2821536 RepID=UPI00353032F7